MPWRRYAYAEYIDGLVQNCSNPIANALGLLQSCTKPSISCWITLLGDETVKSQALYPNQFTPGIRTIRVVECQRRVSQIRALQAACRELAVDYNTKGAICFWT